MDGRNCLCCARGLSTDRPRQCPECGHVFKGYGWDGIDAHWRAKHEDVMPYEEFWGNLCGGHKGPSVQVFGARVVPMEENQVSLYVWEIGRQCGYVLDANKAVAEAVERADIAAVYRNLHSLLTHATCVGRILWAGNRSKPGVRARTRNLRAVLGIDDSYVVLPSNKVRNCVEHFDERLDERFIEGGNLQFVDGNVGPIGSFKGLKEAAFRHYDPTTGVFTFRDEEIRLADVVAEVTKLMAALLEYSKRRTRA